jgi:transposase InsO family protein
MTRGKISVCVFVSGQHRPDQRLVAISHERIRSEEAPAVRKFLFVIARDRRRILHFDVTRSPTSAWVIQQLREAFPYDSALDYLIFDRGSSLNAEMIDAVKTFGIQPKRTSYRSPWQNGFAERWVGTCCRDLLDYVIVLNVRRT